MNYGLSDQVRARAKASYVRPAVKAGKREFPIPVKPLLHDLEAEGFPRNHTRQVCEALLSGKFQRENGIKVIAVDGPPSKNSTTVVVHYRVASTDEIEPAQEGPALDPQSRNTRPFEKETPEEWAHRVTGKIFGLLKDELAEYGGGEGFLKWVRGHDEEDTE